MHALLQEAWKMPSSQDEDSDEMLSARDSIAQARQHGKSGTRTLWQNLTEVELHPPRCLQTVVALLLVMISI